MLPVNSDGLTSFLIWIPFIIFFLSSLIFMALTYKTVLNKSSENGHPCFVSDLKGNTLFFSIEDDVSCGFVIYGFYYAEVGSLFAHFLKSF